MASIPLRGQRERRPDGWGRIELADSCRDLSQPTAGYQSVIDAAQATPGRLAFWSVDRDQSCTGSASGRPECPQISQSPLDLTKIFTAYAG